MTFKWPTQNRKKPRFTGNTPVINKKSKRAPHVQMALFDYEH